MDEESYSSWCYVNSRFKKIKFIPEKEIEEIAYDYKLWGRTFPKQKGVDFEKLKLTNIGQYSIAKLNVTRDLYDTIPKIYNLLNVKKKNTKDLIITESNGGMGGVTIALASLFKKINVVEIIPKHAEIIKYNIGQYGLSKKVNVITADYMDVMADIKQDIIISDPPWGGKDYNRHKLLKLHLNNVDITCIINKLYEKNLFNLYVLVVPYNFDIKHFMISIKVRSIFIKKYKSLYIIFILNDNEFN